MQNHAQSQPILPRRTVQIVRLVILFFIIFLVLGCDQDNSANSSASSSSVDPTLPIKAKIAEDFLAGIDYLGVRIEADHFDPITQILTGVRVTTDQSLLTAARAEIRVNYAAQTAQLILYDVVTAGAPESADETAQNNDPDLEGTIFTYDRLELDPFPIKK